MFDNDFSRYPLNVVIFYHVEDAQAGLNFSNEGEADRFKTTVEQMLQRRKKKIGEQKIKNSECLKNENKTHKFFLVWSEKVIGEKVGFFSFLCNFVV